MSTSKIIILISYAVLAAVAVVAAGSPASTWAWGILALLAVAHTIEMAVFYQRCRQAGGSMATHMLNVFLFGVFHIRELKTEG